MKVQPETCKKIAELRRKGVPDRKIRKELGLPLVRFYYTLAKCGLPMRSDKTAELPYITLVTAPKRIRPVLMVSTRFLKKIGIKPGQKVSWKYEDGFIVGEILEES